VKDRIDTAFRLISNAKTELERTPINTNIEALHNALFGLNWDDSKRNNIKVRYQGLSQISQHNDNDQTVIDREHRVNSIQDVRFYCTVKRIQKRGSGDKVQYMNKDRNIVYEPGALTSPGGSYANCFDIIGTSTMMITLTVEDKYSEIQICPWYLKKARGFRRRDLSDIPSSIFTSIGKVAIPALGWLVYRPIDLFVLTDKMIVHELTHTHQAKFPTIDMSPAAYGKLEFRSRFLCSLADVSHRLEERKKISFNLHGRRAGWSLGSGGECRLPCIVCSWSLDSRSAGCLSHWHRRQLYEATGHTESQDLSYVRARKSSLFDIVM
jgi:hypothetical protein